MLSYELVKSGCVAQCTFQPKLGGYNPMAANAWTVLDMEMQLDKSESRKALAHMDISQRFALDV